MDKGIKYRLLSGAFSILLGLILSFTPWVSWGEELPKKIEATPAAIEAGKQLYEQKCAHCHGVNGDGEGSAAERLRPKPRDFTRGLYKIRTTYSGKVPADEDLFRIITNGMPGTSMPAWGEVLTGDQRWQLVFYIRKFSERFEKEQPGQTIDYGKEISSSAESVAKGRELFLGDYECIACHGEEGRGDGKSAPDLKDEWGNPIRPANLTKNWLFRGGGTKRDIFRSFTGGLSGTPMPAFGDPADDEETKANYWHLANFVKSLSPDKKPEVQAVLKSYWTEGAIPTDPNDPKWDTIGATYFPLVGQVILDPRWFAPSIDTLFVKSFFNAEEVAFLLIWDDPTASMPEGDTLFADAIVIQFPTQIPTGNEKPYFIMGDTARPVNLWRWQSDTQKAQEIIASGIGSQSAQAAESQGVEGQSHYKNGRYTLVLKRKLKTDDQIDIQFEMSKFIPIAFFAWDGSNGETGSKMAISTWYYLVLEEPPSNKPYIYSVIALLLAVGVEVVVLRRVRQGNVD